MINNNVKLPTSNFVLVLNKDQEVSIVPKGWKRDIIVNKVVYTSPSLQKINSLHEMETYLLSENTCKCGLECSFLINHVFNFDPRVQSIYSNNFTDRKTKFNCKHYNRTTKLANNHNDNELNSSGPKPCLPKYNYVYVAAKTENTKQNLSQFKIKPIKTVIEQPKIDPKIEEIARQILEKLPKNSNINVINQPILIQSPNTSLKNCDNKNVSVDSKNQTIHILNSPLCLSNATVITVQPENATIFTVPHLPNLKEPMKPN